MRTATTSQNPIRTGLRLSLLVASIVTAGIGLIGMGDASGAVQGSKMTIRATSCTTSSCQITATMTGVVKVTPTGTVDFSIGRSIIVTTGGTCLDVPMVGLGIARASATCDATGLSRGTHMITVTYSGDSYFDPSTTTKAIRVKTAV